MIQSKLKLRCSYKPNSKWSNKTYYCTLSDCNGVIVCDTPLDLKARLDKNQQTNTELQQYSSSMSSTERSIPHLRDIFSINSYSSNYSKPSADSINNQHTNYYSNNDQSVDRSKSRKKRDNSKTLTTGDIKTLERHLSMKKTIRKKIMRDLQQMYTDDPNEFRIENTSPEQLKAEVRVEALRFGERPEADKSDNFLDMLRGENTQPRRDYDYDSPVQQKEKQSFWKRLTMKSKSNR